jgi:death-on-curing protein
MSSTSPRLSHCHLRGILGARDEGAIEGASALNTYFCGNGDLYDVAAAYAFHLAEAQGFIDGNKRTGVAAALAFLGLNGCGYLKDDGRLYQAMIAIAEKQIGKPELASFFRQYFNRQILDSLGG